MKPKDFEESKKVITEVSRHTGDWRGTLMQDCVEHICKFLDEKFLKENPCKCGGGCERQVYPVGEEKVLGVPENRLIIRYSIRSFEGDNSEFGASIIETPLEVGDIGQADRSISFVEPMEYKRDRKFREKVVPMFKEILEALKEQQSINWTSYQHDFHAALCDLENTE
jgi:hypothetical protein